MDYKHCAQQQLGKRAHDLADDGGEVSVSPKAPIRPATNSHKRSRLVEPVLSWPSPLSFSFQTPARPVQPQPVPCSRGRGRLGQEQKEQKEQQKEEEEEEEEEEKEQEEVWIMPLFPAPEVPSPPTSPVPSAPSITPEDARWLGLSLSEEEQGQERSESAEPVDEWVSEDGPRSRRRLSY
jgi:hypothetical protein